MGCTSFTEVDGAGLTFPAPRGRGLMIGRQEQEASWWSGNAKVFFQNVRKSESCDINVQQYSTPVSWKHPNVLKDGLGNFVIKHRLELYKSTLRQHTFYRNWSLWDRGLIYCIYHWKEESARKRVSAFRQIDSDIWFFQGMMISPYVSLYLVTVYLTTCHRNWLGRLKPGKWNDFETKWNTDTNKQRDKYPKTHIVDLF